MAPRASTGQVKRGPGRPPGNTSDATRANILGAARVCFARQGFALATNRDIAEGADITPAAIYQYFDSKAALYVEAAREAIAEVLTQMRIHANAARDSPVYMGLSQITLGLLAVHRQNSSLTPFLMSMPLELQRHPEIAQQLQGDIVKLPSVVASLIGRGVRQGEVERSNAAAIVAMYIACLMGLSQYSVLATAEEAAGATQAFTALLEGRLFAQGASKKPKKRSESVSVRRASRSA